MDPGEFFRKTDRTGADKLRDGSDHDLASEEVVVRAVRRRFQGLSSLKDMQAECRGATGQNKLTLAWFLCRYPSFPLWLGVRKVQWQRDVFGGLDKHFTKTPCYLAYDDVLESRPEGDDRSGAVVFTWPHFGVVVLHQYDAHTAVGREGLWIVRALPSLGPPFVIEPFGQLLDRLDWEVGHGS
jgi:hypothetical protein